MDNFIDKLAQRYNAGEMIKANSEAETAEMQNLQEQVEAYEAVLQEMRKLNYKNTELTEKMYSLVDESIEKVRTLQIEAASGTASTELVSKEMSDAVTGALNAALNNMDVTVAKTISESLATALAQPTEDIKQLSKLNDMVALVQASVDQNKGILQTVSLAQEADKESMSVVTDNVKVLSDNVAGAISEIDGVTYNVNAIKDNTDAARAEINDLAAAVDGVKNNSSAIAIEVATIKDSVEALKETLTANAGTSEAVSAIEAATKEIITKLDALNVPKSAEAETTGVNEELKNLILEISAGNEELKNSVKNVKTATDDSKASLKQNFDSAIYGLKQDNREIVEFMQRMNTNLLAKQNDPEKEQKEEEARQREEENKKALEERFKTTEDFMHKESVKVYRNVQAVINEKGDQQTAGLETKIKANTAQIGQVKVVAIVAAVLSGLSLVAQVLSILNIF